MSGLYSFFERPYPSANGVLLHGPAPVLVDPGFGSDVGDLMKWLSANGVQPEALTLVVNTHYHSDHVGGNHALQTAYGVNIAAHPADAELINRRDPTACAAEWLRQPVESYTVNQPLRDGDCIDTGAGVWRVLHTPGHTVGHISLFQRETGVLIAGDTAHSNDVGWLNPFIEGDNSLAQSIESLKRLAASNARVAFSGHGSTIGEPATAIASGLRRLNRWVTDPEGAAWHAAKRILAYALMIEGGIPRNSLDAYLAAAPWAADFARTTFSMTSDRFAKTLLDSMLASGSIAWREDRLVASSPHTPTVPTWPRSPVVPSRW